MSNDSVFHRRNKQIQDAIDSQNLKQALQLCEKRIKKGEDSRFLRAWKAYILFSHTDEAHHQRGIAETLQICGLDPPTTDLDTLDMLFQTLKRLDGQESKIQELWEKAARAKPQDLQVQLQWFTHAFESRAWKSAQKAAMSLQNHFSKTRKYYFWAIFLSYLVAIDPSALEPDRKLFGTLAYRMVSKAADVVPADPKELLSQPRAIQSSEELFLLIKIFESQGRNEDVVKILDSANLGLNSRIVQNEWFFVRTEIDNLQKAELWEQGLDFARHLLTTPEDAAQAKKLLQERDDWAVWALLLSATQKLGHARVVQETQAFIEHFLSKFPWSRNANLALLDLVCWKNNREDVSEPNLLRDFHTYYRMNSSKIHCFNDLRKKLQCLTDHQRTDFIDYVLGALGPMTGRLKSESNDSAYFQGVVQVNALKFEYCLKLFSNGTASVKDIADFVRRCLVAFHDIERPDQAASQSIIETQPSDDLCLLAAMSLIKGSDHRSRIVRNKSPSSVLICAAAILEHLLQKSPHNYNALLLLVRIYLMLGAVSLALKTFSKLSVKQMQFETVSHNLCTRLSTLHPQAMSIIEGDEPMESNPQAMLMQILGFYRGADTTSARSQTNGLDRGSYVNVEGALDLQRRLNQSICRRISALEIRRMQRLVGGEPIGRYTEKVAMDISPLFDQRVFVDFLNCEPPEEPAFEEQMRLGPLPQECWVKSFQVTDQLFSHLNSLSLQKPIVLASRSFSLKELRLSDDEPDMTSTETENAKIHSLLLNVVMYIGGDKSIGGSNIEKLLGQVEEWLRSTKEKLASESNDSRYFTDTTIRLSGVETEWLRAPSWVYLHENFSLLETLKAISQVVVVSLKQSNPTRKIAKSRLEVLQSLVNGIYESIKKNTRSLKEQLAKAGVLGKLIELALSGGGGSPDEGEAAMRQYLEETLNASELEVFCGKLMESWEDGLEGILGVISK